MKCPECGNELSYDALTEMYYCSQCNILTSPKDLKKKIPKDDIALDEEDGLDEIEGWEPESLGGFSLFILDLLQSVPIVGFLVPFITSNADISESDKRFFSYRFIQQIFVGLALIIVFLFVVKDYSSSYKEELSQTVNSMMESLIVSRSNLTLSTPEVSSDNALDDIVFVVSYEEEEYEDEPLPQDYYETFDGVFMSGSKVIDLIESTESYMSAYLVQTLNVAERHGEDVYRNVGYILDGAYNGSTSGIAYYIEESKSYELHLDDYGDYMRDSIDDLTNSKYIFYVKPASLFRFNVITSQDGTVIGFMFTEIEDD